MNATRAVRGERIRLGVNIDHVATLRQTRGTSYPDPLEAARLCLDAKADGITVHLREDRRHIQEYDVYNILEKKWLPLNLEMAHTSELVRFALDTHPDEVCIVPEKRQELTTEGGLDLIQQAQPLRASIKTMLDDGIGVSLFIDSQPTSIQCAAELGARCIELHTGTYCDADPNEQNKELDKIIQGAVYAHELGLQVNAGHGLHRLHLKDMLKVPFLHTLNIGHSLIARSIFVGLKNAIQEMKEILVTDEIMISGENT